MVEFFMPFDWFTGLMVTLASLVLDVVWVFSVRRTAHGIPLESALYSALVTLVGGIVTVEYVSNRWYILFAALGAFVGSLVTVSFDSRGKRVGVRRPENAGP